MKMGRTNLKCDGVLPEKSLWSHAKGEDPELDYLLQFENWPGFNAWLDSVKIKVMKEGKTMLPGTKKVTYIEDDYEIQDSMEWLLEFLPDVPSREKDDDSFCCVIPGDELEKLENMLFCLLADDHSPDNDFAECTSAVSVGSRHSRSKSRKVSRGLTRGSTSSKRSKRGSTVKRENGNKLESRKNEGKKVSLVVENNEKKGKKNKKGKNGATPLSKKQRQKEEPVIEEETSPKSQMPLLLELFEEFDAIQREKEEFYECIQDMRYPENPCVAVSPPHLIIMGFHQYQVYKATFSVINTSAKAIQLIFDKINSPQNFLFKVKGPGVARIAPGGYQHFCLEFCCDEAEDVEANISYLIRNYDQSLTQRLLPIFCYSCCNAPYDIDPENTVTLTELSHNLSQCI